MSIETHPVPLRAKEQAARGVLGTIAEKRKEEIEGHIKDTGKEIVLFPYEEGLSGVMLLVANHEKKPPPLQHARHSVVLMGLGEESAVVTSGGKLISPQEETISGAVIFGEFTGKDIDQKSGKPLKSELLNAGEHVIIPKDTAYMIRPINGGTAAALGVKFRG